METIEQLEGVIFSFYHVGLRELSQMSKIGDKWLCLVNQLSSPPSNFLPILNYIDHIDTFLLFQKKKNPDLNRVTS